jgi:hypothetical protein
MSLVAVDPTQRNRDSYGTRPSPACLIRAPVNPYRLVPIDPRATHEAHAIAALQRGAIRARIAFVGAFAAAGVSLGDLVGLVVQRDALLNGLTFPGATAAGLLVFFASTGMALFVAAVLRRPCMRGWARLRIEALVRAGCPREALETYALLY